MNCKLSALACASVLATCTALMPQLAQAHGYAGQRFFPATIVTDDPFVSDELSLPTISTVRAPNDDGVPTRQTVISIDYTKRITSRFGLGFGESYLINDPERGANAYGYDNLALSAKYLAYVSAPHETLLSVGVDADIGGTGVARVGAEGFSVITPSVFFGKGLGDLPHSMGWLRAFAVTGVVGVELPTRAAVAGSGEGLPHVLDAGVAIEYSIPYLQQSVRDIGLGAPFDRLIPLVEIATATPLDRGQSGQLTGTVNPGILWIGQRMQIGIEANIPINSRTGGDVGVTAQLHWFLDDIFPDSFGKPLFS